MPLQEPAKNNESEVVTLVVNEGQVHKTKSSKKDWEGILGESDVAVPENIYIKYDPPGGWVDLASTLSDWPPPGPVLAPLERPPWPPLRRANCRPAPLLGHVRASPPCGGRARAPLSNPLEWPTGLELRVGGPGAQVSGPGAARIGPGRPLRRPRIGLLVRT